MTRSCWFWVVSPGGVRHHDTAAGQYPRPFRNVNASRPENGLRIAVSAPNIRLLARSPDRRDLDEEHAQKVAESIRTLVNIDPIVIDENDLLIDGRHRLRAHEILGRKEIEVRVLSGLSEWQKQVIQFEANYRRKQLTPAEEALELAKIHKAYVDNRGKKEIRLANVAPEPGRSERGAEAIAEATDLTKIREGCSIFP